MIRYFWKRFIKREAERIATLAKGNYPKSESFNKYFFDLASRLQIAVPYTFVDGELYDQERIDMNFKYIIAALERTLSKKKKLSK